MTTTTPALNPRVIALAHYAARALLEHALARHGMTFQQSVTLRLAAVADGPVERDRVIEDVVGALKTDPAQARSVLDELVAEELVAPHGPSQVRITDAGRELFATTSAATAPITARVYEGIPEEDLVVAGRVLSLITERANKELVALKA
ncbi:DNA-binding MarR family transcriptional regulator [Streptomyces sp. SAI-135]|uniref:MarR family transcriptional regulator n=1 Tax=unclassified Streptomyces TaxID=2593676 RepID=UPI00247725E0|nr:MULTISPECIES: MarR family transcriptional regulator [unclassified Streptomyces]MDH6514728.1 DNA-binding MarR family transcriptional regulator [Streptomyces sp. SAI-090]MDH6566020.1 DNA-binding MarR family transcriptional regulator [Streptomyces sp. SAI-117]MDH6621190.1 DNA-binding MarR family transcriptional regulator [Streptomyces sp. SAI-135]